MALSVFPEQRQVTGCMRECGGTLCIALTLIAKMAMSKTYKAHVSAQLLNVNGLGNCLKKVKNESF